MNGLVEQSLVKGGQLEFALVMQWSGDFSVKALHITSQFLPTTVAESITQPSPTPSTTQLTALCKMLEDHFEGKKDRHSPIVITGAGWRMVFDEFKRNDKLSVYAFNSETQRDKYGKRTLLVRRTPLFFVVGVVSDKVHIGVAVEALERLGDYLSTHKPTKK